MNNITLVLGSSGMLGQALIRELGRRAFNTTGVARRNADICLDITDRHGLAEVLQSVRPSLIINTAAITELEHCEKHPVESYLCNTRPSQTIIEYCVLNHARYVYISTDQIYCHNIYLHSNEPPVRHRETDPVLARSEYALSKYLGEQLALTHNHSLVIRANIAGFRNWPEKQTFVEWVTDALRSQSPITAFNDYYTSTLDVVAFSSALCDLIDKNACGIVNLGSSEVASKQQFIEALAVRLGFSTNNVKAGRYSEFPGTVFRNNFLGMDVSHAEQLLGYTLPGLHDVIENLATQAEHSRIA